MPLAAFGSADPDQLRPYLERLRRLQAAMDQAWEETAAACGFVCRGCPDNCCYTRFDHHTLIEVIDLCDGLARLAPSERERLRQAAEAYPSAPAIPAGRRHPCPLLVDGRCRLYAHRPMICRMHGLPHRLRRPDGTVQNGPGCDAFHQRCETVGRFDRTPFYRQMAGLESELKQALGVSGRIRLTVAEMVRRCPGERGG